LFLRPIGSLAAAIFVGRWLVFKKGEVVKPSSVPYVVLGAGVLLFG